MRAFWQLACSAANSDELSTLSKQQLAIILKPFINAPSYGVRVFLVVLPER
jgi:hypothetical protein